MIKEKTVWYQKIDLLMNVKKKKKLKEKIKKRTRNNSNKIMHKKQNE